MASKRNIYVGTFSKDNNQVPIILRGMAIYYAPDLQTFAIFDKSQNKTYKFFKMPQYRAIMDAGCIDANSQTIDYIEDEYERWAHAQEAEDESANVINEMSQMDADGVMSAHDRSVTDYEDTMTQKERTQSKDPTRHVGSYFVTVMILAIVAIVCRVVIMPLVQQLMAVS
jgi:hypothetical protein